ncbi:LOW QUALITY PROTEIN: uncharacterized protein FYW35_005321 [Pterocles gutturalis]
MAGGCCAQDGVRRSAWAPLSLFVCVCHGGKCVKGINLAAKTQGRRSRSLTASLPRHPATTRSFFRAGVPAEAGGSVGGWFPVTPPRVAVLPRGAIGCPQPGAGTGQRLNARVATPAHSLGHPIRGSWLGLSQALEEMPAHITPQATGTTTDMRAVFLVLLLCAGACARPVPGREPIRPRRSTRQEDTASKDDFNKLGNLLGGGDGRHPPGSAERGDNALAGEPAGGNAVGELHSREEGGRAREAQHLNWVDHEDTDAQDENSLGFLEEDARDDDDGDDGEHHGAGGNGLPSHAGGLLDEEDDSGDYTFDENGQEEGSEGPTYVAGADGAGDHGQDLGRGDTRAGRGHGDSSSSSSSESIGADHRRYRSYLGSWYQWTYRQGGGSSSSQEEEERYDFEDEGMQGDDPSVFDGPGSSYKGWRAGPYAPGGSRGAGSHPWEEGDSRSPEAGDGDSEEDSPSTESEEPTSSQTEENSASPSREDGEDSRSGEGSESREGTEEELGESPEDISEEVESTLNERGDSPSREEQEDQASAEDRSTPSAPDSASREDDGDQSKSEEDDGDQSQSPENTVEESQEDGDDSTPDGDLPSASTESQSASPEDDGSPEDDAGEDSRSVESSNSTSQEDDDDEESHSQEDATHESSSRGDNSLPHSLESQSRKRRPGAYRKKPAVDYDDNDCQDGY